MKTPLVLSSITTELPEDFRVLQMAAANERFGFVQRLIDEWQAGTTTFDEPGEVLHLARQGQELVGVGGVTADPFIANALRMRRFYVHPEFRRRGVGQYLAAALIEHALTFKNTVTVNATTALASAFWEKMGFHPVSGELHTHVLDRSAPTGIGVNSLP